MFIEAVFPAKLNPVGGCWVFLQYVYRLKIVQTLVIIGQDLYPFPPNEENKNAKSTI